MVYKADVQQEMDELDDQIGDLRPSQRAFIFNPATQSAIEGGWASGKSFALCTKGLVLSAFYRGNVGLIGRFAATDLTDSTMMTFFDICPPTWIKSYQKARKVLHFKNGSTIMFRHIHDPNPKRKHITSTNLGWLGIDQAEEITRGHWDTLMGRLRLPRAKKRFGFLAANPNGMDWIYEMFFPQFRAFAPNEFYQTFIQGSRFGVAVRSEENRKINGGYVDDSYFDELRENMPPEWVRRYLDCSFEEFAGKIYQEYHLRSVHNIERFQIPNDWNIVVGIDVGGTNPWAVVADAVDPWGNMVSFAEFYKPSVRVEEVARWIKTNLPWNSNRVTYVIDWENKLASLELQDHGIHCRPAIKHVKSGILRVGGYVHIQPRASLPPWYKQYQPPNDFQRWDGKGSPSWFVMKHLEHTRKEFDRYIWDPEKGDKPKKENDHCPDARRYSTMSRPQRARPIIIDEARKNLRSTDPLSGREWDAFDRRVALWMKSQRGDYMLREAALDETGDSIEREIEAARGGFDWND